jgi:uncharacterized protein YkwD
MANKIRNFDVREELRATAARRMRAYDGNTRLPLAGRQEINVPEAASAGEGVPQIAARLAQMFPTLPVDTVRAVLSQLFRADARITREVLADRAVIALIEMTSKDSSSQALTSFEPCAVDEDMTPCQTSHVPLPNEASDSSDDEHEHFDALLAEMLAVPDEDLQPCLETLYAIFERIATNPENDKIRRLRLANKKFAQLVGRHDSATQLLRFAGFEDDVAVGGDDHGFVFHGSPSEAARFKRVLEALRGIIDDMFPEMRATSARPQIGSPPPRQQPAAVVAPPLPRPQRRSQAERIAMLTEERLRDPRAFREQAKARGASNRVITNIRLAPDRSQQHQQRRAQHFDLSDIDRMRVDREIENMPNYAEEYRRTQQATPARDYSTIVSRSYDPELISREAVDLTNMYRASKGMVPVRWNEGIARIAAEHAASMAAGRAPFSHDGFDARVRAFPVAHRGAGENLALNSGVAAVAQTAVDGWIKSPGHEKNLRGSWDLCGIGAARSPSGTWYLTQLFARAM